MRSCHRSQGRFCAKKGKDIPIVQNKKEGSIRICKGSVEKGIYLTVKVATNITSVLCTKEGWKEEEDTRLSISEQLDD